MAAIDNLYGNRKEWKELNDFLSLTRPEYIYRYMKEQPDEHVNGDGISRICYIADIQEWLIEKCPLEWVKERLENNFEIQRMLFGHAHHENYDDNKDDII